jgi:hypothetical protein
MKAIALVLIFVSSAAAAGQISLSPPPGYSGGLSGLCVPPAISTYALGFDGNGNITGELEAVVTCHNKYGPTTRHWDSVIWDADGNFLTLLPYDGMVPGPFVNNIVVQVPYYNASIGCWASADNNLAVMTVCFALAPGAHSFLFKP